MLLNCCLTKFEKREHFEIVCKLEKVILKTKPKERQSCLTDYFKNKISFIKTSQFVFFMKFIFKLDFFTYFIFRNYNSLIFALIIASLKYTK